MAFRDRPQRERYHRGQQRQLCCPHCEHQFEVGPQDIDGSGKVHCPSCGREENVICAHGCKKCARRSEGCGHSHQIPLGSYALLEFVDCDNYPKIPKDCPGCGSLFVAGYKTKGTTCTSCCRPLDAQCLKCLPSKNDICKSCWLDWCAVKLPVTLQLIEEDGESRVTCTNLAGTELIKTEGDLNETNVEKARLLLQRCMETQVMDQDVPEKRLARNWQPYDQSEFQEYYGDRYEREWSIAAPIPVFKLILLGVDGEELKSKRR